MDPGWSAHGAKSMEAQSKQSNAEHTEVVGTKGHVSNGSPGPGISIRAVRVAWATSFR
jgi:hypothetical protein